MTATSGSKLYMLPLGVGILFPLTFVITYFTALGNDHIVPFFAYISDTGGRPPESLIFAQLLNIAGLLIGCSAYVRYKQVQTFFKQGTQSERSAKFHKYNKIGLVFGLIAALGSSVVGIFNEIDNLPIHVVGAWMAFGGGSIFFIFQAIMSYQMVPLFGTKVLATFRLGIGVTCFVLFVLSFITGIISSKYYEKVREGDNMLKWRPDNGGWWIRVTSVTTEWIMAALLDLYFFTLVPEFKRISMAGPRFSFVHVDSKRQNGHGQKVMMERVGTNDN